MAEIVAFMNTTRQGFVAFQEAHMKTIRIRSSSGWATDLFALMSLALFAHVADFVTDKNLGLLELLLRH